jgi:F420-dependent oxidoreductase-like protein
MQSPASEPAGRHRALCMLHGMRYGAFIPQGWRLDLVGIDRQDQWPTMLEVARSIESSGYESLWVFDHFHTVPIATQESSYEAWTLMAALAATTGTVRLGQMCTSNSYRNPAYLAKVAADIDVISSGRLEMGIGAGWYDEEYVGYGYEFPKPSVRIGQLEEGVEIMRRMWTEEVVEYHGKYYDLEGAISNPKPVQGSLPMWIAGGGEQLTLRVAAKYADYTNFGIRLEDFVRKSEVLAEHCADVGRNYDEIVRSAMFHSMIDEDEAALADKLDEFEARLAGLVGSEKAERSRRGMEKNGRVGTPEQVIEKLRPWVDAGAEYFIAYFPDAAYDRTSLELFAKAVMPAFM